MLSLNSLTLAGKSPSDEVVFLHVPMFMLDGTLQKVSGTSSDINGPLRKILALSG